MTGEMMSAMPTTPRAARAGEPPQRHRTRGLDQTGVREVNTAAVLRALVAREEDTGLQTLALDTGLSRRTVELILGGLVENGWAHEVPAARGAGAGRPARQFRFAAAHRLVAGARIDTHAVRGVVADLRGRVLGETTIPLGERYFDPDAAVATIADAVTGAAAAAGVGLERVVAGGVASGGVVDVDRGAVRRLVYAPAWNDFPLGDALGRALGFPWLADNDANLAALAELRDGIAGDRRHIVWLIHGNRTGAGIVIGNELHRGSAGAAGELIESRVLGLERDSTRPIGRLTSPIADDRAAALEIVAAAERGDEAAIADATGLAAEIADIIDVLTWTVAPELVVLGGGLEQATDLLVPLIRARLDELGAPSIDLAGSTVGRDAPVVGAVRIALDRIDADFYGPVIA